MKETNIGEFQEIVLLAILILDDQAYGLRIQKEISSRLKRELSRGALHTALTRLEEKGFLESRLSESTSERGGKRKRLFYLTPFATKALDELSSLREKLRHQMPQQVFKTA